MHPKFKLLTALRIWVVLYPSITMLLFLIGDQIAHFPLGLRTLILTVTLVPWVIFVGLPAVDFITRKFKS